MSSIKADIFKMSTIAEKFKIIRDEKRLTQQALADMLSVKKQNISNIESGHQNPSAELLKKLVDKLNVNLNWLIADRGSMFIAPPNEALKDELRQEFEELLRKRGL